MHERRSTSFAHLENAEPISPRLAPPLALFGLVAVVTVLLYGLYPRQQYIRMLEHASFDDPLTARLARGILEERPDARHLFSTLIQAELRRDRFRLAAELARQWQDLAASPGEAAAAYWLGFDALRQGWHAQAPDSANRAAFGGVLLDWLDTPPPAPLSIAERLAIIHVLQALEAPLEQQLTWLPSLPPAEVDRAARFEIARLLLNSGRREQALAWLLPVSQRLERLNEHELLTFTAVVIAARRPELVNTYLAHRVLTSAPTDARRFLSKLLEFWTRMDMLPAGLAMMDYLTRDHEEILADRALLIELVQAARAGGRTDLAARWAIQLLRLSLSRQGLNPLARGLASAPAAPQGAGFDTVLTPQAGRIHVRKVSFQGDRPSPKTPVINLPFDDTAYSLAFLALVEDRKLDEAWLVAKAAVAATPSNPLWRLRMARVSEWSGRPRAALEHWQWLARERDDPQAWEAVLRLAPGLLDWEALRRAYARQARKTRAPKDMLQLVELLRYLGETAAARDLLRDEVRRKPAPWALEKLAMIEGSMGEVDAAIQTWRALERIQPLNAEQAMHLTTLLIGRGLFAEALALLEKAPDPHAPEARHDVLNMRLELARMLGRVDAARRSMEALDQAGLLSVAEIDVFHALLERHAPRDAATLASDSWRRFRRPLDLQRALYLWSHFEAWDALGMMLDPEAMRVIETRADLLILLAQYRLATGRPDEAHHALAQALRLSPDDPGAQSAMLWLLIGQGRVDELRQRLAAWEPRLARDARWHDMLGAAYQTLSMPAIALERYLLPQAERRRDDLLWALNLADALEQNGQPDQAWRIRRALWSKLKPSADRSWLEKAPFNDMQRIARIRLSMSLDPGDRSLALIRELMRQDRNARQELSENARVLVAGWLQNEGLYEAERGWLWSRFAESMARPTWAEVATALNLDDVARTGELLETRGDALPRQDRVVAEQRVHDLPAAQTTAFEGQEAQRNDQALQSQLEEVILAHSDQIHAEARARADRVSGERSTALGWRTVLGTRLALDTTLSDTRRTLRDPAALGRVYDHRALDLALEWQRHTSRTGLRIGLHQGATDWTSLGFDYQTRLDRRIGIELSGGWREPSETSTALRMAGWQHRLRANLSYSLSARDQFTVGAAWQVFETQAGDALGHGHVLEASYTHWLRLDARDLGLDLFVRQGETDFNDGPVDSRFATLAPAGAPPPGARFFSVEDSTEYGLRLHTNQRFARQYSRAWRPYASAALFENAVTGLGHDVEFGLAGSLLGADHLNLFWRAASAREQQADTVRQLGFSYRIHY